MGSDMRIATRIATATAALLLMLSCPAAVLAQNGAPVGPPVAFAPVTAVPVPLQTISGRWNSLNPRSRNFCPYSKVSGRVVSTRLILVKELDCGQGIETANVLVNAQLSNPAYAVQMIIGRRVAVTGIFRLAQECRTALAASSDYLIADKAELVAGDPIERSAPAFTSYMICQPPELDALATQLGGDLSAQSTIVANLGVTGPVLETAACAPANLSPTDTVSGDPDAISCRLDTELSGLHLQAIACARGSYWVWYNAMWRTTFSPTHAIHAALSSSSRQFDVLELAFLAERLDESDRLGARLDISVKIDDIVEVTRPRPLDFIGARTSANGLLAGACMHAPKCFGRYLEF